MKDADWSQWTPPAFVADLLHQWAISEPVARPQSGSLLKLVTRDGHTQVQPVGGE
jgi:hypothetical protein